MKVVITGGSGFVGNKLVQLYHTQGYKVISCQRTDLGRVSGVIYKFFDYTQPLESDSDFQDIDIFIHCGSCTDYTASRGKLYKQNVESLKNIQMISSSAHHFIYISSSSVYQGIGGNINVSEEINETNLKNSYSYSKYMAEQHIQSNFKNTYISILRPRAIYGDGDTTLIPQVLKNSLFGYLLLPGNGTVKTSVSEIGLFCKFVLKISKEQSTGVYNFSSEIKSYREIYIQICDEHDLRGIIYIPLWILKLVSFRNNNKYSYIVDTFGKNKILE